MKANLHLFFLLISISIFAQCPPDGQVSLTTQAEVNAYLMQYPTCTVINGNLNISGATTTDVTGLNIITTINGALNMQSTGITNGNIFNNLTTITQLLNVQQNLGLTSITGFNALITTPSTIQISGNNNVTSITGFANLTTIGQNLNLSGMGGVTTSTNNISGFSNVRSVGYLLMRNTSLPNLNQLSGLQTVNLGLSIDSNPVLNSITGLSNATNAMVGNGSLPFRIFGNPLLTSLNGINFSTVSNVLDVQVRDLPLLQNINQLSALTGNFSTITISNLPLITNLNGLNNVTGANSLTLINNAVLASLPAWNFTTASTIIISSNPLLTSLASLSGLTAITTAAGFNALSINGNGITSLQGLQNLTNLNGRNLQFNSNLALTDISALNNLTVSTLGTVTLSNNTNLSTCSVPWLCTLLAARPLVVNISGNATACATKPVVTTACEALSTDGFDLNEAVKIYPNPFTNKISISLESDYTNASVKLFDISGKRLYSNSFSGNSIEINGLENLSSGIYFVTIETDNGTSVTKKIIK